MLPAAAIETREDRMAYRYGWRSTWLTPPTKVVFVISVVLALLAVVVWLGFVRIPVVQANLFATLLIAYGLLLAGNLVRGM
jgi:hypothetical protein